MEWSCLGCDTKLVMTSHHLECLSAVQCSRIKRNCWDEKLVWWAPAVVKHKKRMSWFLVLVGSLDRPPKWAKDLQSSEPEVGCAGTVTSGEGTRSALDLFSALSMWKSIPECASLLIKNRHQSRRKWGGLCRDLFFPTVSSGSPTWGAQKDNISPDVSQGLTPVPPWFPTHQLQQPQLCHWRETWTQQCPSFFPYEG